MSLKNVFIMETTGNIVRMLGLAEPIAKWFTELNPRADFALAKSFVLWHMSTHGTGEDGKTAVEKNNPEKTKYEFAQWKREMGADLAELLKTKPALEKKINVAKTHEDVMDVLNSAAPETDVTTLLDLGEGWKWVELTDRHHSKEARQMQHCATDGRGDLVSLRDPQGNPHVTMTYNKDSNVVFQIKGKQNKVPDQKYWEAIVGFFTKTQSDIKDSFIKRGSRELFDQIKTASGKEIDPSNEMVFQKLAQAISSDAAKQWAWDTQPFTFDNPDIDYDELEGLEEKIEQVFKNAGYNTIEVEPSSGQTTVFYFPENWSKISEDPLDRIEEVPSYEDVYNTWQGITMWVMAKEGIVNPTVAKDITGFGQQNAVALNAVYSTFGEIFGGQEYTVETAIEFTTDNNVDAQEYEEFTNYKGSSGQGADHIEKLKRDNRWTKWSYEQLYGDKARERWGDNYFDNPEHRELQKQHQASKEAGEEPPEE